MKLIEAEVPQVWELLHKIEKHAPALDAQDVQEEGVNCRCPVQIIQEGQLDIDERHLANVGHLRYDAERARLGAPLVGATVSQPDETEVLHVWV